jgi:hypothetical protein
VREWAPRRLRGLIGRGEGRSLLILVACGTSASAAPTSPAPPTNRPLPSSTVNTGAKLKVPAVLYVDAVYTTSPRALIKNVSDVPYADGGRTVTFTITSPTSATSSSGTTANETVFTATLPVPAVAAHGQAYVDVSPNLDLNRTGGYTLFVRLSPDSLSPSGAQGWVHFGKPAGPSDSGTPKRS